MNSPMKISKLLFWVVWLTACSPNEKGSITKEFIDPASGYSQAVVTTYNGLKTIHISGQIGEGDDLRTQMTGALRSIESILEANGATFSDVVKMNHYIVNYQPEDLGVFRDTRKEIMGDVDMPASTLVGVTALFSDKYLIEIDAIAIVEE